MAKNNKGDKRVPARNDSFVKIVSVLLFLNMIAASYMVLNFFGYTLG